MNTTSLALGARGSTRKKLAAAGCILEYIGQVAVIAGRKRERRQGRDYLEWLLKQKSAWSPLRPPFPHVVFFFFPHFARSSSPL